MICEEWINNISDTFEMFTEMQYGKYGGIGISYFPVEMSACIIICLFSCIIPIASSEYEMKKIAQL